MKSIVCFALIALSLLLLPVFRGGYPLWPQLVFGILAPLTLLFAPKLPQSGRLAVRPILVLWFLYTGLQLIQAVPIPMAWLESIAPHNAALWKSALSLSDRSDAYASISLRPIHSMQVAAVSAAGLCYYLALVSLLRSHAIWRTRLLWLIVAAGLTQALYGTFAALGVIHIQWLEPLPPVHRWGAHGSFPNRNHFAAFLIPAAACALALLRSQVDNNRFNGNSPLRRWLDAINTPLLIARIALLVLIVAVVLSRSRMGNLSLALSISLFGLLWLWKFHRQHHASKVVIFLLSIAVVDILLISNYFGLDRLVDRLESTELSSEGRTEALTMSSELVRQYGWVGAGPGTYQHLEHHVRPTPDTQRFVHAHNDHLEQLIEFGMLGYALIVSLVWLHALAAWRLLASQRGLHQSVGACVLVVILAAALHSTVEFLFQIPAWRLLFVSVLAFAVGVPKPRQQVSKTHSCGESQPEKSSAGF